MRLEFYLSLSSIACMMMSDQRLDMLDNILQIFSRCFSVCISLTVSCIVMLSDTTVSFPSLLWKISEYGYSRHPFGFYYQIKIRI